MKYLAHAKQMQALELIPEIAVDFKGAFGRDSGGLIRSYRAEDAETIVVALGSVLGTIKDTIDELREQGVKIGVLGITSFRPFPLAAVREALGHSQRLVPRPSERRDRWLRDAAGMAGTGLSQG